MVHFLYSGAVDDVQVSAVRTTFEKGLAISQSSTENDVNDWIKVKNTQFSLEQKKLAINAEKYDTNIFFTIL